MMDVALNASSIAFNYNLDAPLYRAAFISPTPCHFTAFNEHGVCHILLHKYEHGLRHGHRLRHRYEIAHIQCFGLPPCGRQRFLHAKWHALQQHDSQQQ